MGLDVGFAWPNGSARKGVENDTDLELSEHAKLGDDTHPRVLAALLTDDTGGVSPVAGQLSRLRPRETQALEVSVEGRGPGTGGLPRSQQSCFGQ